MGAKAMWHALRQMVWREGLKKDCKKWHTKCHRCASRNLSAKVSASMPEKQPPRPFAMLVIDLWKFLLRATKAIGKF